MQVLVNCDDGVLYDTDSIQRIEGVIVGTLERFSDRVFRVEAHLADLSSAKPGDRDKICSLEARIAGATSVVAKHAAATLAEAIHDAADQLERFVAREIRLLDRALAGSQARPSARSL
jgi:Sigma 54 modulation protein / S30EA ribosomal protein